MTTYSRWRLWKEAKGFLGEPVDLAKGDEPCGRTILKAVCWMERVAEFAR